MEVRVLEQVEEVQVEVWVLELVEDFAEVQVEVLVLELVDVQA